MVNISYQELAVCAQGAIPLFAIAGRVAYGLTLTFLATFVKTCLVLYVGYSLRSVQ